MSKELGMAGFEQRLSLPSDALICQVCGGTLGERRLLDNEVALSRTLEQHKPECRMRLEHQRLHRSIPGPCDGHGCPGTLPDGMWEEQSGKHDKTCRHDLT